MNRLLLIALAVVGAAVGVGLTVATGTVCVDGTSESFCGLNFLVWNLSTGAAIAAAAFLGAAVGILLGFLVSVGLARRSPAQSPRHL
jgi:hypothetical protein